MDSFTEKIVLVVVAFLLGLLADVIKKAIGREKRRLAYSIFKEPIVEVGDAVPSSIKKKLPSEHAMNIVGYKVFAENTGTKTLQDVNVLIVPSEDAELLDYDMRTNPPREVRHSDAERPSENELRYSQITLEKGQSIELRTFLRSEKLPNLKVYWSGGGGDVDWKLESTKEAFGLEEHLIAVIKYYIFAQIASPLMMGLSYLLLTLIPSVGVEEFNTKYQMGGVAIGQILGTLLQLYFYIKIVPHAIAAARDVMKRRATTKGI